MGHKTMWLKTTLQQIAATLQAIDAKLASQGSPFKVSPSLAQESAEEWLSIREAATVASLSDKTIRRAIRKGELAATNVNNSVRRPTWRIRRSDLEGFMKANVAGHGLPATLPKVKGRYKSRHFPDL